MKTRFKTINTKSPAYVIAEISHNHQGDGELALELVRQAAAAGADAVKFQKRSNNTLYHPDFYNSPYTSSNSFGDTYGAHREFLEPRGEWLLKANELAHSLGIDFIMTAFDLESLQYCEAHLSVDAYKIQSSDLTYHQLIQAVAAASKPYFISCGAASLGEIKASYSFCRSLQTPFCIMYAVSAYPTPCDKLNLTRVTQLKEVLSTDSIGYSCHFPGIKPSLYARALGCVAIEKHFTLDKSLKGPDHKLSLLPSEMCEMVEKLKAIDCMMGAEWTCEHETDVYQRDARLKMGKSPVARKDLLAGDILCDEDVAYLSPANGISPADTRLLIGKQLHTPIKKGSYIQPAHFSNEAQSNK